MNQIETANRFINVMLDAEGKLSGVKQKIDDRKRKAQELIAGFAEKQKMVIDDEKRNITSESSLRIFEDYRRVLDKAVESQKQKHLEFIKGTEFIHNFE